MIIKEKMKESGSFHEMERKSQKLLLNFCFGRQMVSDRLAFEIVVKYG
ncbi:hypothetical protein HanXRQr2_Chr12g0565161 [Helianthus annuus]|uniref:Uncharacterized protein n=1 Tax=Helianthus annuus TaxID=4232 RepID=A0A9K3HKS3_HELAN|nr:hypothetical protein HanXRQr2_Chr12g0565161 [Helianthus annuus]